jgi:tetratricopeptide (TPR) repeat protein
MGQKEKAMEVYRNLVAADPKSAADLFAEINKPATTNTTASAAGTAEYFVNEGGKFRDAENYTNAIESYKKAIALKPGLSLAHLNLGFCYFQLKQYEAALSPFQQAARLDPADADNYFWLGVTYYKLKQYPSAMTTLKEAIRLNPKSPFNHYDLGETYLNGFAQYDKAVPEYQEAIRLKPDYDLAHNQLGLAYLWQNQYPDALIEFQTAFRLKGNAPESSPTYLENIGIAYVRLGKKDEAMKVYQMLQKSDVTKAKELLALINNPPLYPTGPAPKPATSVKVVKSSSSTASLIEQAVTYFDARDFAKAIEACKKAMVAEPKNQKANFYLAMSYDQSEQWENAVKAWNNYIPLVNSGPNEFILLGDAHRYLKHYNEALNAYQKALDLKPDAKKASGVYYWIGTIYNDTKQYDKAIDSLLTSISLDPNYRHSRLALGRAYLLTGRPPEGIASLKEAIRIKPDFAEAHYYLGLCYLIVEKKEKAMEEYKVLQTVDKSWASELLKHINSPLE